MIKFFVGLYRAVKNGFSVEKLVADADAGRAVLVQLSSQVAILSAKVAALEAK